MPGAIHDRLVQFIEASGVPYRLLRHPPCRTSAESAAARAAAGAPNSIGAKALIIKAAERGDFLMAVLPGDARLTNDSVRRLVGKFRFADPEEIALVAAGLSPGMILPFIGPVLPELDALLLDERISREPLIGFNAAHLERSIVMSGADYLTLVNPMVMMSLSTTAKSNASGD